MDLRVAQREWEKWLRIIGQRGAEQDERTYQMVSNGICEKLDLRKVFRMNKVKSASRTNTRRTFRWHLDMTQANRLIPEGSWWDQISWTKTTRISPDCIGKDFIGQENLYFTEHSRAGVQTKAPVFSQRQRIVLKAQLGNIMLEIAHT